MKVKVVTLQPAGRSLSNKIYMKWEMWHIRYSLVKKFIDVVKSNRILFDVNVIEIAFYVQHFTDYSVYKLLFKVNFS